MVTSDEAKEEEVDADMSKVKKNIEIWNSLTKAFPIPHPGGPGSVCDFPGEPEGGNEPEPFVAFSSDREDSFSTGACTEVRRAASTRDCGFRSSRFLECSVGVSISGFKLLD